MSVLSILKLSMFRERGYVERSVAGAICVGSAFPALIVHAIYYVQDIPPVVIDLLNFVPIFAAVVIGYVLPSRKM